MRLVIFGIVFAVTLTLAEQQKTSPAGAARIEGVVLDGVSARPLANVTVAALQETNRLNAVTDAQGRFSFTVSHGTVRIATSKDGFATLRPEGHSFSTNGILITVTPSQQLRGLKLPIFPTGTVTGIVYDSKVKPVQYARAQLLRYAYDENGERALRPAGIGRGGDTNDHGEFRIDGVDPGSYFLQVMPPLLSQREPGEPFDMIRPMPITVNSGADTHVDDMTLPSVRGATLRIRLVNQTGESIQNTMSKYLRWSRRGVPASVVVVPLLIMGGPERAEIPVTPGVYEVVAGWTIGSAMPIGLGRKTVEAGRNNIDVELVVTKGVSLTTRIVLEQRSGQPRPAAAVRCEFNNDLFGSLSGTSVQDGSITLTGVQPATYRIACSSLPPDTFVSQIKQGDRDALKNGVQIDSAGENSVVVTLSGSAGTAEGVVSDDKGQQVSGSLVVLVPDAPFQDAANRYATGMTDQHGGFRIRAVAPGTYRVYSWKELEGEAFRNAEFMKKAEKEGSALKVEPGTKATVAVKLSPTS